MTLRYLFLISTTLLMWCNALAQELPTDPDVKMGQLSNGFTYYVRHYEYPKGKASFHFVQRTGSYNETDDQWGLAHFTEHMCFNGSKHFPGNTLDSWLASVGLQGNYNAETAFDHTSYYFADVPAERTGIQDSILLVLHDWACDLDLDDKEIDSERSVIIEEIRMRNDASRRLSEASAHILMPNSKYPMRSPGGSPEQIATFGHQSLRDYYHTWYRPDLQGIIVVGDVDADYIVRKITELFGNETMPQNPQERIYEDDIDTDHPIVAIGTDKELAQAMIQLVFIHDKMVSDDRKNTANYFAMHLARNAAYYMLNKRLQERALKGDCPFVQAQMGVGVYSHNYRQETATMIALPSNNAYTDAVKELFREVVRAAQYGFTPNEYTRFVTAQSAAYENMYNNRNQVSNETYASDYKENFFKHEPILSYEQYPMICAQLLQQIPLEMVNQLFASIVSPNRLAIDVWKLYNDGEVTEQAVLSALSEVMTEDIAPYVDNTRQDPLIAQLPQAGKVVSETHNDLYDATVWTLSNGAKVIVKQTDYKDDEVVLRALANNGHHVYSDAYADDIAALEQFGGMFSFGTFSANDLRNYLVGKSAALRYNLDGNYRGLYGESTHKDLPTLMELIYAAMTAPNLDETEFETILKGYTDAIRQNEENNPHYQWMLKAKEFVAGNPRYVNLNGQRAANISRERLMQMYTEQFTRNAADFTFAFTGSVSPQELKPLVEQYIASLPGKATKPADLGRDIKERLSGPGEQAWTTKMESPQSLTLYSLFSMQPYSLKNEYICDIISTTVSDRLMTEVREKMGAVYSINCEVLTSPLKSIPFGFNVAVPINPALYTQALEQIKATFAQMATDFTDEDLNKAKENLLNNLSIMQRMNNEWSWMMALDAIVDQPASYLTEGNATIQSITTADVKQFVHTMLKENNIRIATMHPAE